MLMAAPLLEFERAVDRAEQQFHAKPPSIETTDGQVGKKASTVNTLRKSLWNPCAYP